ncbi:MAG: hypothetical protein Kow0029_29920 [Candidatus Rifleibacteriota bacterium]
MSKRLVLALFLVIFMVSAQALLSDSNFSNVVTSDQSARCLNCHYSRQKKLVENWEKSKHARNKVGCYECHHAEPSDSAAKNGHFGFSVQLPVSPNRCAECHPAQYNSFASSSHSLAYETIRNAELASASPVLFETTCASCHGNELLMMNGRPDTNKWPNHGIGRINTDGSRGSCVACHSHHDYSLEFARSPETCGRCHRGMTGPAYEAWKSSKHGSNWSIARTSADFNASSMIPSEQPVAYPDCFICHIAATGKDKHDSTHNPGERLSWKLAAVKSSYRKDWGKQRQTMQNICRGCHGNSQVELFYRRFDATVMEINSLTGKALQSNASDTEMPEIIKNHAISAKTGAAMLGPVYLRDSALKIKNMIKTLQE